ncbi:21536_t:CDS:1, partial [Gigaspora rosea]
GFLLVELVDQLLEEPEGHPLVNTSAGSCKTIIGVLIMLFNVACAAFC